MIGWLFRLWLLRKVVGFLTGRDESRRRRSR
jgi:hypothetical protein